MHTNLPETGFLRLNQIVGQAEVSEEQAAQNRSNGKFPKRSREAIPAIIPVARSTWLAGVASGRYPRPVKLSPGVTVWRAEDIRLLLNSASEHVSA